MGIDGEPTEFERFVALLPGGTTTATRAAEPSDGMSFEAACNEFFVLRQIGYHPLVVCGETETGIEILRVLATDAPESKVVVLGQAHRQLVDELIANATGRIPVIDLKGQPFTPDVARPFFRYMERGRGVEQTRTFIGRNAMGKTTAGIRALLQLVGSAPIPSRAPMIESLRFRPPPRTRRFGSDTRSEALDDDARIARAEAKRARKRARSAK